MGSWFTSLKDSAYQPFAFPAPPASYDQGLPGLDWAGTIPILWIKRDPKRPTVLYSHGNGCDLGHVKDLMKLISQRLNANVISYDYPGYGLSPGNPSEKSCYQTIAKVYSLLISEKIKNIILMGQSIGTGPTTWLACQLSQKRVPPDFEKNPIAVVLITPFTSALSVMSSTASSVSSCLDIFDNNYHLNQIDRPVQIIAGTNDHVTPYHHAQKLQHTARFPFPMVSLIGAGHNDVFETRYQKEVFDGILKVIGE